MRYIEGLITEKLDAAGWYHCEDGPAVVWNNGDYQYRKNGLLHRIDGPASVRHHAHDQISEAWYVEGKLHREGGPAVSRYVVDADAVSGKGFLIIVQYWLNDTLYAHDDYVRQMRRNIINHLINNPIT